MVRQIKAGSCDNCQLDPTAYPVNSGCSLADVVAGEVVGVTGMVLIKGTKESTLSQPTRDNLRGTGALFA